MAAAAGLIPNWEVAGCCGGNCQALRQDLCPEHATPHLHLSSETTLIFLKQFRAKVGVATIKKKKKEGK